MNTANYHKPRVSTKTVMRMMEEYHSKRGCPRAAEDMQKRMSDMGIWFDDTTVWWWCDASGQWEQY